MPPIKNKSKLIQIQIKKQFKIKNHKNKIKYQEEIEWKKVERH